VIVRPESPNESIERTGVGLEFDASAGIVDDRLDLPTMPNDSRVEQETPNVVVGVLGNDFNVEFGERTTKVVALPQDGEPAQTRLKTLEADLFEETTVVVHGASPFSIVVLHVQRVVTTPPTPVAPIIM